MNKKKWYTMKAVGGKAELSIYADIGFWGITAADFKKELNSYGKLNEIELSINSYGGEVYDGFAIYNDLKETGANITVTIKGIAASIASYIAMAGNKIKIHKNAMIMIHNPSVCMCGGSDSLRREATVLDNMKDSSIKAYKTHAKNLTDIEISEMMDKTTYLTAENALDKGFVDEILDSIEVEEPETNSEIAIPLNYRKKIFTNQIPAGPQPAKGVTMGKCKCGKEIPENQTECLDCAVKREVAEAKTAENARQKAIRSLCKASKLPDDFIEEVIDLGKGIGDPEVTEKITNKIKEVNELKPPKFDTGNVKITNDESDKFRMHASNCLALASGLPLTDKEKEEIKKDEMVNSLHNLMRIDLQNHGVNPLYLSPVNLVDKSFTMIGMGSSDLPAVLANVISKAMGLGYNEQPVTWNQWCGTMSVADFKQMNVVKMSAFADLDKMPEGAGFKEKKLSDKYETVSIDTYGGKASASRNMLINDDLNALARVPRALMGSAARTLNKAIYTMLTSNSLQGPSMVEKSYMILDANGNLVANSGIPSVTTISAAVAKLMAIKLPKPTPDAEDEPTNFQPRFLITGINNMLSVETVLNSAYRPDASNGITYNPYANNRIIPVFDAYLQNKLTAASKANGWYVATDKSVCETITVAFLEGQTTPTLRSEASRVGESLGIVWDIFFDWGIATPDFRGIVFNDGATAG